MVKTWISGVVLGLVLGLGWTVLAQTPAAPPAVTAPAAGALDDGDRLLLEIVAIRAQLAQCQSEQLDSMKQFSATRAEVVKRIEAKHPGYSLDLKTGKLVAKAK